MGSWNLGYPNPSCGCGCATGGQVCVTVTGCSSDKSGLAGTTVSLSQGGTTIGTATVDPNTLKACVNYPSAGTYTLTVTAPAGGACFSYQVYTTTLTLSGGTTSLNVGLSPSAGWSCCTNARGMTQIPVGTTLHLTWACGFAQSVGNGSSKSCEWQINSNYSIDYIGNCTWQLSYYGTDSLGNPVTCTSTCSGPPSLPVSLTFQAPTGSGSNCPYPSCDATYGFSGGGSPTPAFPLSVSS